MQKNTLNRLGIFYDSQRSFQTTNYNPIYDKFVKWQFLKLKKNSHVKFGKRLDIYSEKDGQACLGHDRSEGEDAKPKLYYLFKIKINLKNSDDNIYIFSEISNPNFIDEIESIQIDPEYEYTKYTFNNISYILKPYNLKSLAYQYDEFMEIYKNIGINTIVNKIKGSNLIGLDVMINDKIISITENKNKINHKKSTSIICSILTKNKRQKNIDKKY